VGGDILDGGGEEGNRLGLANGQSGTGVDGDKRLLHSHHIRLVILDDAQKLSVEITQALPHR